jgi:hypothetical protein
LGEPLRTVPSTSGQRPSSSSRIPLPSAAGRPPLGGSPRVVDVQLQAQSQWGTPEPREVCGGAWGATRADSAPTLSSDFALKTSRACAVAQPCSSPVALLHLVTVLAGAHTRSRAASLAEPLPSGGRRRRGSPEPRAGEPQSQPGQQLPERPQHAAAPPGHHLCVTCLRGGHAGAPVGKQPVLWGPSHEPPAATATSWGPDGLARSSPAGAHAQTLAHDQPRVPIRESQLHRWVSARATRSRIIMLDHHIFPALQPLLTPASQRACPLSAPPFNRQPEDRGSCCPCSPSRQLQRTAP